MGNRSRYYFRGCYRTVPIPSVCYSDPLNTVEPLTVYISNCGNYYKFAKQYRCMSDLTRRKWLGISGGISLVALAGCSGDEGENEAPQTNSSTDNKTRINELENEAEEREDRIEELEDTIQDREDRIEELENEIKQKEERIEELEGQIPDTDASPPIIHSFYLQEASDPWMYIGRRFGVPKHSNNLFYVTEHITIKDTNGKEVFSGTWEVEVDSAGENGDTVMVTPSSRAIHRLINDIGVGEYEMTLVVEDTNIDQRSSPKTATIEINQELS